MWVALVEKKEVSLGSKRASVKENCYHTKGRGGIHVHMKNGNLQDTVTGCYNKKYTKMGWWFLHLTIIQVYMYNDYTSILSMAFSSDDQAIHAHHLTRYNTTHVKKNQISWVRTTKSFKLLSVGI